MRNRIVILLVTILSLVSFGASAATRVLVRDVNFDNNYLGVTMLFYNESGSISEVNYSENINGLGIDSWPNMMQEIEEIILAKAAMDSISVTADDIVWGAIDTFSRDESAGVKGYLTTLIDGTSQSNTTVFTNNSGRDFWVTQYGIMPETITGLGTAPVINLGKTASAYNDIDSGLSLAIATNAGKISWRTPGNNAVKIANGESLVVRVSVAAILTTAYDFKVLVRGVYTD